MSSSSAASPSAQPGSPIRQPTSSPRPAMDSDCGHTSMALAAESSERESDLSPGPHPHREDSRSPGEHAPQQLGDRRSPRDDRRDPRDHVAVRQDQRHPALSQRGLHSHSSDSYSPRDGPQHQHLEGRSPHTEPGRHVSPPIKIKRSASASPRPLKRKFEDDTSIDGLREGAEYDVGQIACETCGMSVSLRDDANGSSTLKHWEAHRRVCPSSPTRTSPPPTKRRRAKRTEDERIAYLKGDPYVAQFEAYRVLCKSCEKWIRLRPNSTYCSIPWDAHRKSCLAKKITSKHTYALEQRNKAFEKDPDVRKFDAERVLCSACDVWISVPVPDERDLWRAHKVSCRARAAGGGASNSTPLSTLPVAEPSSPAHSNAAASPASSHREHQQQPSHHSHHMQSASHGQMAPQYNESRRRNAEQRAATLRADSLILHVEPNRVFCSLCQKWVQLRQDSSYCAYPWLQHRNKCLIRSQKRAAKERVQPGMDHSERHELDAESEDAEASWDEEEPQPAPIPAHLQTSRMALPRREIMHDYRDRERERDGRHVVSVHPAPPPRHAQMTVTDSYLDLDSPTGRLTHLALSIAHLLNTTFRTGVPVAALLGFMNASMPEDRWEEYDWHEVVKGVGAIAREAKEERNEGSRREVALCIELEGDVVRPR